MRWAYWNGAIWAVGNGLASTTLVVYLAYELNAPRIGLGIGLILAARHVVGLLRLGAPALIGRLAERKRFCLASYALAALLLLCLPSVTVATLFPSARAALAGLVSIWCCYHLLQYAGTIALWSWLADLVPLRIRGRFIGRRQRWMVGGEAASMLSAGLFVWGWKATHPDLPGWIAYAIPAVLGACLMIAALVPLSWVPRVAASEVGRAGEIFRPMLAPFGDRRFLRLLAFGCWFSLSNGLTQSAQFSLPKKLIAETWLGAGAVLFVMLALKTGMRMGQLGISPWMGRMADRWGNRPVMIGSLLLVAQGPLFYFFSTPEQPMWFAGAWLVWIAYAGMNVCLPNLMLKLSPRESNLPYIAAFFAITGLCYAANTIVGGMLYDRFHDQSFAWFGRFALDYYRSVFLLGWIARSMGLLLLLAVIEGKDE